MGAVNKTRIGFRIGSDFGSDRTPDWIGSDRTGIFAFGAGLLFLGKCCFNNNTGGSDFFFRTACVSNKQNFKF